MLDRALVVEYWQDPSGRFVAEARTLPINATGETLALLRTNIAERIREVFRGATLPSVYDLILREGGPSDQSDEGVLSENLA